MVKHSHTLKKYLVPCIKTGDLLYTSVIATSGSKTYSLYKKDASVTLGEIDPEGLYNGEFDSKNRNFYGSMSDTDW